MTNSTRNTSLRLYMDQYELTEHEVARIADVPLVTCGAPRAGSPSRRPTLPLFARRCGVFPAISMLARTRLAQRRSSICKPIASRGATLNEQTASPKS